MVCHLHPELSRFVATETITIPKPDTGHTCMGATFCVVSIAVAETGDALDRPVFAVVFARIRISNAANSSLQPDAFSSSSHVASSSVYPTQWIFTGSSPLCVRRSNKQ